MKHNPFLIAGYHSPIYFCDREVEAEAISNALNNGRNLTLLSPRRMGKTGLIHHTFHKIKQLDPQVALFYMDIFSTRNLSEFVQLFASTIFGKLDTASKRTVSLISKFIKTVRPVFTLDEFSGSPKITIDIAQGREETSLVEIFDYLKASEKKCYIAIDEFQQIVEYPEKGVEALLRSHIQFMPHINFIFSGSKRHIMNEIFLSAKRPFFQSTQILAIDKIDKDVYYRFAADFFNGQDRKLTNETFSAIYDAFNGHTWYIQTILNRLYSYREKPDDELVKYAISEILSESGYMYASLLSNYSASNIRLLKAIAEEKCVKEINAGDFISRHKLKAASSVNSSLNKLIDKELIYKTTEGYIVYDRFMDLWIRRQPY